MTGFNWLPWCDICNEELTGTREEHAEQAHNGEAWWESGDSTDEIRPFLVGKVIETVEPLDEGEGGLFVLGLRSPEGKQSKVFLRATDLGWWFSHDQAEE